MLFRKLVMDEDFSRDRERTRQVTETSQYVRPRRALAPGSLQLKKWLGLGVGSLFVYPRRRMFMLRLLTHATV